MKYLLMIAVFANLLLTLSCHKDDELDPNYWALPPNILLYQFVKNGTALQGSQLDGIEMFYINDKGDTINHVPWKNLHAYGHPLFRPAVDTYWKEGFENGVCSQYFITALIKFTNTFYFKFPDGDIDTLYIDYTEVSIAEGKKLDCYCQKPFTTVLFNGQPVPVHPTIRGQEGKRVYIFNKD